jgi:hypothetical protein
LVVAVAQVLVQDKAVVAAAGLEIVQEVQAHLAKAIPVAAQLAADLRIIMQAAVAVHFLQGELVLQEQQVPAAQEHIQQLLQQALQFL